MPVLYSNLFQVYLIWIFYFLTVAYWSKDKNAYIKIISTEHIFIGITTDSDVLEHKEGFVDW
jgi:hypothetical protein